jgi:hypothetical protein
MEEQIQEEEQAQKMVGRRLPTHHSDHRPGRNIALLSVRSAKRTCSIILIGVTSWSTNHGGLRITLQPWVELMLQQQGPEWVEEPVGLGATNPGRRHRSITGFEYSGLCRTGTGR